MHSVSELLKNLGADLNNVIPLILLFAFWWIFSMLTTKIKKGIKNGEEPDSPGLQERFLSSVTSDEPTDEDVRSEPANARIYNAYKSEDFYFHGSNINNNQTTAKPIHPRWWAP